MRFHSTKKYIPADSPKTILIAGCDEAGRGPWAGPVVAAAVILPPRIKLPNLNDSKKIPEPTRDKLFSLITAKCEYGIGIVSHTQIDQLGLTRATELAHQTAVANLPTNPDYILIDGRDKFTFPHPHTSIVKGDSKLRCIAAASILAKVTRDRIMTEYDKQFPQFQFASHKGYGTRAHQTVLNEHGPCEIHRKSFSPIRTLLK